MQFTLGLQDAENFVSGHTLDLRNTMGVTQNDANLRRSQALLRALDDIVDDLGRSDLKPRRG